MENGTAGGGGGIELDTKTLITEFTNTQMIPAVLPIDGAVVAENGKILMVDYETEMAQYEFITLEYEDQLLADAEKTGNKAVIEIAKERNKAAHKHRLVVLTVDGEKTSPLFNAKSFE
ncbi:MAG: hypothetical protein LBJ35_00495 [Spirochaetaceae bacterium]|nr:hypothetical protein [Spirochaetaceae bacterium]